MIHTYTVHWGFRVSRTHGSTGRYCTWSRRIEERLPVGRGRGGELLLACSVALEVLFARLQDVLEVLRGILKAQPQAVHNGCRVALAL